MLHKTQQPITDPLLTPEEMASLQAMSLEEVRLHPAGPWLWGRLPWPQPSECAPHPSFQAPIPHPIFLVLTPCSPSLTLCSPSLTPCSLAGPAPAGGAAEGAGSAVLLRGQGSASEADQEQEVRLGWAGLGSLPCLCLPSPEPPLCRRYHRVLKKSRRRQALKEFEQLHKSDPAAALARLEELEQLRMQVLPWHLCPIPQEGPALWGALCDASLPPGADEP